MCLPMRTNKIRVEKYHPSEKSESRPTRLIRQINLFLYFYPKSICGRVCTYTCSGKLNVREFFQSERELPRHSAGRLSVKRDCPRTYHNIPVLLYRDVCVL